MDRPVSIEQCLTLEDLLEWAIPGSSGSQGQYYYRYILQPAIRRAMELGRQLGFNDGYAEATRGKS